MNENAPSCSYKITKNFIIKAWWCAINFYSFSCSQLKMKMRKNLFKVSALWIWTLLDIKLFDSSWQPQWVLNKRPHKRKFTDFRFQTQIHLQMTRFFLFQSAFTSHCLWVSLIVKQIIHIITDNLNPSYV